MNHLPGPPSSSRGSSCSRTRSPPRPRRTGWQGCTGGGRQTVWLTKRVIKYLLYFNNPPLRSTCCSAWWWMRRWPEGWCADPGPGNISIFFQEKRSRESVRRDTFILYSSTLNICSNSFRLEMVSVMKEFTSFLYSNKKRERDRQELLQRPPCIPDVMSVSTSE